MTARDKKNSAHSVLRSTMRSLLSFSRNVSQIGPFLSIAVPCISTLLSSPRGNIPRALIILQAITPQWAMGGSVGGGPREFRRERGRWWKEGGSKGVREGRRWGREEEEASWLEGLCWGGSHPQLFLPSSRLKSLPFSNSHHCLSYPCSLSFLL